MLDFLFLIIGGLVGLSPSLVMVHLRRERRSSTAWAGDGDRNVSVGFNRIHADLIQSEPPTTENTATGA